VYEAEPPSVEPGAKIEPSAVEQWSDDGARAWVHRCEAPRPGAANQPEEERLGLVVGRVAQCDHVAAKVLPGTLEEGVPCGARRVLNRLPAAPRKRSDIFVPGKEGQAQGRGGLLAKALIGVGGGTELVVEVGDPDQIEHPPVAERPKQVDERHRIGSARNRGNDPGVRLRERVSIDGVSNPIDQIRSAMGAH
jgi:hypothetical protein